MPDTACSLCTMDDILDHPRKYECLTCGHEWDKEGLHDHDVPEERVVKDAYGNILQDGDIVQMIKDKKLTGTSSVLKSGTKSKPIRLQDGDHEIACKMNGLSIGLKAQFVKKVQN